MKTNETLKLIGDKEFLDKIYQFSYRRCNTSYEAEDLCSDIILAVISAVHRKESIENFYAFVWTIARRVYADYSEKRNQTRQPLLMQVFFSFYFILSLLYSGFPKLGGGGACLFLEYTPEMLDGFKARHICNILYRHACKFKLFFCHGDTVFH